MRYFSLAVGTTASILLALLLWRAARGKYLTRFPLYYSYAIYILYGSTGVFVASQLFPALAQTLYWPYFLLSALAEFGVLVEISDHVFNPFQLIRFLGRVIALCLSAGFFFFYILPCLLKRPATSVVMLDLVKRASLAKAAIIVVLLVMIRHYGLTVGKNVAGMLIGFSIYLGTNVANFALAEAYGRKIYYPMFAIVLPVSYTLCVLVWTVALWRYEPVVPVPPAGGLAEHGTLESLTYQLERFNTTLGSILRK